MGAFVFVWRLHNTGVMLAVCRTDAGREGSRHAPAPPFKSQKEEEEEEAEVVRRGVKKSPSV